MFWLVTRCWKCHVEPRITCSCIRVKVTYAAGACLPWEQKFECHNEFHTETHALACPAVPTEWWVVFFSSMNCVHFIVFFIGLVSLTTHYIHYKDTFLMRNVHSIHNSLSRGLAPSKDSSASAVWSVCLCYGWVYALHLWTSKQHYILFPISKHFPEGTTRKHHCFFEGSVQLHVPKSTWLPGRPFCVASEQLRWSSFGIYCVLWVAFVHRGACSCVLSCKCLEKVLSRIVPVMWSVH